VEKSLEERINAIENRLSKLEGAALSAQTPTTSNNGKLCKRCQTYSMEFVSQVPHPHFGDFGQTNDTYKCQVCNFSQTYHEQN
jgi:hypothetical protein